MKFSRIFTKPDPSRIIEIRLSFFNPKDIVSQEDILPYHPIKRLNINNRYFKNWFEAKRGFESRNQSQLTEIARSFLKKSILPLRIYEDESDEMRVSIIPLFVNSQLVEEFSVSLMEPDEENGAWRNNDLAGQIKLQKQYTGRNEPGRPISSNTTDIKGVDNSKSF